MLTSYRHGHKRDSKTDQAHVGSSACDLRSSQQPKHGISLNAPLPCTNYLCSPPITVPGKRWHIGEWEGHHDHNGQQAWMYMAKKITEEKHTQQQVRKTKIAKEGKEMHIQNKMEMIFYQHGWVYRDGCLRNDNSCQKWWQIAMVCASIVLQPQKIQKEFLCADHVKEYCSSKN